MATWEFMVTFVPSSKFTKFHSAINVFTHVLSLRTIEITRLYFQKQSLVYRWIPSKRIPVMGAKHLIKGFMLKWVIPICCMPLCHVISITIMLITFLKMIMSSAFPRAHGCTIFRFTWFSNFVLSFLSIMYDRYGFRFLISTRFNTFHKNILLFIAMAVCIV